MKLTALSKRDAIMKATDLMIKDLVLYKNNPIQIAEIITTWDSVNGRWFNSELEDDIDISELRPIPLTSKILLKNGFGKGKDKNGCTIYQYSVYAGDGYSIITVIDYDSSVGEWGIEVTSYDKFRDTTKKVVLERDFYKIHDLQHAMCLCGLTKEIEL